MLKSKYIDGVCIAVMMLALVITILFMNGRSWGVTPVFAAPEYEKRLFDQTRVHRIDIFMDHWEDFLENAAEESYSSCTMVID